MAASKKVTIREVAEAAGVAASTVSRVLTNHYSIGPATVDKVKLAIKETGYVVKQHNERKGNRCKGQKASAEKGPKQVALLTRISQGLLQTPVYYRLIDSLSKELSRHSINLTLCNLPPDKPHLSIPSRLDGAVLFHINDKSPKLMRKLRQFPCTAIMGERDPGSLFDHITYNSDAIGQMAADYFEEKGHRSVASLYWNERTDSLLKALHEKGIECLVLNGEFMTRDKQGGNRLNFEAINQAVDKLVRLERMPTAIFTFMDMISIGFHHAFRAKGIEPMKDIDIVGANNDTIYLDNCYPRPHTIDICVKEIARQAVERLLWRKDNPKELIEAKTVEPVFIEGDGAAK